MSDTILRGLDAADPLAFLAALGVLRVVSRTHPSARLRWVQEGQWFAALEAPDDGIDIEGLIEEDVERWREGHPALDFAVGADRKIQDLKHPPNEFRSLMRTVRDHPEAAAFVAAYATGVVVDGTGQTKPTSFHLTAGRQLFMDAILSVRDGVDRDDLAEALHGPWEGRVGPKNPRWRAGSERSRALLSFDPSKDKAATVVGAVWLAFQGLPFFPAMPVGSRVRTTGFTGRGRNEVFTWPVWSVGLTARETRVVVGLSGLQEMPQSERDARGIRRAYRARVLRSAQGYGNFAAAEPV